MSVKPGDKMSVTLLPLNMMMKQRLDMVLFTITDHSLVYAEDAGEGIRMKIKLKRKITSEMMTTYFPSLLLMMITFATTFFRPFFFEAALSVNLTTMLVMTTIFISKMEGLPPTSATKMIDYWLILCQLVPFAQVVLLTAMEYLREGREEKDDPTLDIIQLSVPLKDNQEVRVEENPKPKEAWFIAQMKKSNVSSLTILMMIGKVDIFPNPNQSILSEKRAMPTVVLLASIVYFAIAACFFLE